MSYKGKLFTKGASFPILAGLGLIALVGCADMNKTQQRTLSGAGIGAGVGAVGTMMTGGCVSCGAAVGAAVGAGGGYIYDQTQKNKK
jgi:hypothetical protein